MDAALRDQLTTSIRTEATGTFDADSTGVLDAGRGQSFVGLFIGTALAAGTTLTFLGYGGGDELSTAPAQASMKTIMAENNDGSAAAAYTIEVADSTGYFPLDAAVFNGCRFIVILSDVDNTDATIVAVSKPV